jgi:hypothetical protein
MVGLDGSVKSTTRWIARPIIDGARSRANTSAMPLQTAPKITLKDTEVLAANSLCLASLPRACRGRL